MKTLSKRHFKKKMAFSTFSSIENIFSTRTARLKILSKVSLTFTLNLSSQFLYNHKNFFELVNRISDLTFINESQDIRDKITISSDNKSTNFALFLNKTLQKKIYIELYSLSALTLCDEAMYLKEALFKIIEVNNIYVLNSDNSNEMQNISNEANITLIIKAENNKKIFNLSKNENNIQSESSKSRANTLPSMSSNTNYVITEEENEDDNFNLQISNFDFEDFDYLYLDICDFNNRKNQKSSIRILNQLTSLLNSLKTTTGISIIINYDLKQFANGNVNGKLNFCSEMLESLLDLFEYTDIFIFNKKESYDLFNILYVIKKDNINKCELNKNKQFSFFSDCIVKKSNLAFIKKFAFFIEPFKHIHIMEIRRDKCEEQIMTYNSQMYPKANHANLKNVFQYKYEMQINYNYYYGILTGTLIGKFISNAKFGFLSSEHFYSSVMTSIELTKKIVEIKKNNFALPSQAKFYYVNIPQEKIEKEKINLHLKKKEEKFVLDCVNRNKSKLLKYNPLQDKHLSTFFASDASKKIKMNKGLLCYKPFNNSISKYTKYRTLSDTPVMKTIENYNSPKRELDFSHFIENHDFSNSTLPSLRSNKRLNVYINKSNVNKSTKKVKSKIFAKI